MHHPSSEPSHLSSLISEIKAFESTILHVNAISINSNTPHYKGFTFDAIKQYLQTLQIPSQYLDRAKSFINRAHEFIIDDGSLFKLASKGHLMRKVITDIDDIRKILLPFMIIVVILNLQQHVNILILNFTFIIFGHYLKYIQTCDSCQNLIHYPINNHHFFH